MSGLETVCSGDTATLTCNITGATDVQWVLGSSDIIRLRPSDGLFTLGERPPTRNGGIDFSFSLLATSPQFVTQLRFVPGDDRISGGVPVTCREGVGTGSFREAITISVLADSKSLVYITEVGKVT